MALLAKFFHWLKPGGRLFISDYCCGSQNPTEEFKSYVADRRYVLLEPAAYGALIAGAGFANVVVQDRTQRFGELLASELSQVKDTRIKFVKVRQLSIRGRASRCRAGVWRDGVPAGHARLVPPITRAD